jgi:hypothetical protein
MTIRGFLRNTRMTPNSRRLSLYFDKKHRPIIPRGKKEPIVLDLGQGSPWHGTMNSVSPNNEPYVHDWLTRGAGKHNCTEVFDNMGVAEQAELEFDLSGQNYFRLLRVVRNGQRQP